MKQCPNPTCRCMDVPDYAKRCPFCGEYFEGEVPDGVRKTSNHISITARMKTKENLQSIVVKNTRKINCDLKLEIEWPEDATHIFVLYGTEEYAESLMEKSGKHRSVSKHQYDWEGGLYLRNIEQQDYYITLYGVYQRNGEQVYSKATRVFFSNKPKMAIYYSIHVRNSRTEQYLEIEFRGSEWKFFLPEIDLVYKEGSIPVYRNTNTIVGHIGEQKVSGTYKDKFPINTIPRNSYLKAFFTNEEWNNKMKLKPKRCIKYKIS